MCKTNFLPYEVTVKCMCMSLYEYTYNMQHNFASRERLTTVLYLAGAEKSLQYYWGTGLTISLGKSAPRIVLGERKAKILLGSEGLYF